MNAAGKFRRGRMRRAFAGRIGEKEVLALKKTLLCALLLAALTLGASAAGPRYCLGARDGRIVWCDLETGAWHETGAAVSQLPNAPDRESVLRGIPFPTRAALASALEDFCS